MPRVSKKKISKTAMIPTSVPKGRSPSDIIMSVSESDLESFTSGEKRYVFRTKPWGHGVKRVWFYVKTPVKSVTHVATVGTIKTKGELDDGAKYSAAFNRGFLHGGRGAYRAAYEILSMSELKSGMDWDYITKNSYTRVIGASNVYVCQPMADELKDTATTKLF
ncbi:hypothetical protein AA313_de0209114 [Arthrobotrys entomopaga]|nr:hypothetical protein AA313_de0209114 [Arthrobotrys entomopaga]